MLRKGNTMQIYRTHGREIVHDREFPTGTIILTLDNKIQLVCWNFKQSCKRDLKIYVWLPTENTWVMTYEKNRYTEIMWECYRRTQKKQSKKHINYAQMMKHDRIHKSGGGGVRVYNGSITDYECTKNPLHDFRRYYN